MLLAGFALAMVPEVQLPEFDTCRDCFLGPSFHRGIVRASYYVYVFSLGIVATVSTSTTIFSTSLNWQGKKRLSKRGKKGGPKMLVSFDDWWAAKKKERKFWRWYFFISLPLFVVSIAASPNIWCGDCILGVCLLLMMMACGAVLYKIAYVNVLNGVDPQYEHGQPTIHSRSRRHLSSSMASPRGRE
ncbi:hypothetical protein CYMTET_42533 [Cymbomonas tetramitiformis]|uniref:Uncharacterized protein n=1 Tax=Cymbomonas tetramitiformis TaxID=36881 RepID=A0AAE0F156_9CHLO|nr:hypothetical protein CYMTET_42533 [Cymbomonas tetramitiformis]